MVHHGHPHHRVGISGHSTRGITVRAPQKQRNGPIKARFLTAVLKKPVNYSASFADEVNSYRPGLKFFGVLG